jgi:hypothetical protein
MMVKFHKSSLFITDYPLKIISNINKYIDFYNPCSTMIGVGLFYERKSLEMIGNVKK